MRCVDSIPMRDDIQIIVVDDNSDDGKKPSLSNREGLEVVQLDAEQSKGAGRARNVGLKYAKGKWLLFSDADDYYVSGFIEVLDMHINESFDVLYFNAQYQTPGGNEMKGGSRLNHIINNYDGSRESSDLVKYRVHAPWNKMVRRSFVVSYGFCFEEVPNGNDSMFTYQVGYFANEIKVISNKLYVYTFNPNSLTHKKHSSSLYLSYLKNIKKNSAFYSFIGHSDWGQERSVKTTVVNLVERLRLYEAILVISTYLSNRSAIESDENKYVERIKSLGIKKMHKR